MFYRHSKVYQKQQVMTQGVQGRIMDLLGPTLLHFPQAFRNKTQNEILFIVIVASLTITT